MCGLSGERAEGTAEREATEDDELKAYAQELAPAFKLSLKALFLAPTLQQA